MSEQIIEHIGLAALRPNPKNARTHSKKQVRQLADSIRTFGFTNPILIDEGDGILAGHGRFEAAKLLGLHSVPCRRLSHMSAAEKRAYALADNKLALNAQWDEELLAIELEELITADPEFDIGVIGFDASEVDLLIEAPHPADKECANDDILPAIEAEVVTRAGDLWRLGEHLLFCGDALSPESYRIVLESKRAQLVFSDPPYNVPIDGNVSGLGKVRHRDFAMACGELTPAEYTSFLKTAFSHCAAWSVDGAIHYHCIDWRHLREMLDAGEVVYDELKNVCVWDKQCAGMGSFYRSRHELIFVFKKGKAPHANNFGLGEKGRHRSNVWSYRGLAGGGAERAEMLAMHPTTKPIGLVSDALRDCSARGDLVLDPFGGSGSILIAAEKTRRRARLIEIDPVYVDRTIRRWQSFAHDDAILAATGERFEDIAARRRAETAAYAKETA